MRRLLFVFGACAMLVAAQVPSNDDCVSAAPLALGSHAGTTSGATLGVAGSSTGCPDDRAGAVDVWFSYTANADQSLSLALSGPGADRFAVFSGTCGDPGAALLCENGPGGVFPIGMAESVVIRVSTVLPGGGPFQLTLALFDPNFVAIPASTNDAPAPKAAAVSIGVGCGGASGAPSPALTSNLPRLGESLAIKLTHGEASSSAWLLGDFGAPTARTYASLPAGCVLYLDGGAAAQIAQLRVSPFGAATHVIPVPAIPELAGVSLTLQALIVPTDGMPTLQLTNGLRLTFGY